MNATCPNCKTELRAVDGLCPACVARVITSFVQKSGAVPSEDEAQIPGYEVLESIGRGGMGVVYRAVRLADGTEVAIKIMPALPGNRAELLERLQREAETLRKLDHPNILRIIDSGITPEGHWFMVTELALGGDLGVRLQKGALPVAEALALFRQVAQAIAEAHRCGIAHRDIKPANILISADGAVRVADFSIAKLLRENDSPSFTLTQTSEVFGTPYYIAPEVRHGSGSVNERADFFSLGVLLHELLSGRLPIGAYVPASKLAEVPSSVDRLIARCLQEDPAKRPPDVAALLMELQRALKPRRLLVPALLGVAAITAAAIFLRPKPAPLGLPQPSAATKEQPWQNSLGMKFVPVPGTRTLVSIWETRRKDFEAYSDAMKLPLTGPQTRWRHPDSPVTPEHPVTPVSMLKAAEFCRWLTDTERASKRIDRNSEYRLPTDEEWSRASGLPPESGSTPAERHLGTGDDRHAVYVWGRLALPENLQKLANYGDNKLADPYPFTAPVGSFPANALGIFDIGGNVSEWCSTRWNASSDERVLRGASWSHSELTQLRLDSRERAMPIAFPEGSGFRVVLDFDVQQ